MTIRQHLRRLAAAPNQREWRIRANLISPEQWQELVGRLNKRVRAHAASIVWFDFFGGRIIDERWPHLDTYVNEYNGPADRSDLINALVRCGYQREYAANRCQLNLWEVV